MFTTTGVLLNQKTNEVFTENEDVKMTFKNGSVLIGTIWNINLNYDHIELNVEFLDDCITIHVENMETIEKIK